MEAQEQIKIVDASFTWPHPTEKGYFVNATFVRTEKDEPYLLYCPYTKTSISIDEKTLQPWYISYDEKPAINRELTLNQKLYVNNEVFFYVIYLGTPKRKIISKKEIEKLFGIQVVD